MYICSFTNVQLVFGILAWVTNYHFVSVSSMWSFIGGSNCDQQINFIFYNLFVCKWDLGVLKLSGFSSQVLFKFLVPLKCPFELANPDSLKTVIKHFFIQYLLNL